MLFNGRMMSGGYPKLFQQALGFTGDDVDGDIGPETVGATASLDPQTLIACLTGQHYAYLQRLPSWNEFRGGWTKRLIAAKAAAGGLVMPIAAAA